MDDVESPFAPFTPKPPMFEAPATTPAAPVKRKRGRPAKAVPVTAPKRRKPRRDKQEPGAKKVAKVPKFDLQTILRVAATLKEPDQKLFEKMLEVLTATPKPSRDRILTALAQVFG